jgi:hypothetical protein
MQWLNQTEQQTIGTELDGAWPPAASVCKDACQGAGEGEWNAGNPMVHSPELGRQRGGPETVVRVAAVGTTVRSMLGVREWEMGCGDGCGEEERAPHPFIGLEGGAGRLDGEGCRAGGGGGINAGRPIRWRGEMGGKCGTISGRGGVIRVAAACVGGGSGGARSGFRRKKKVGPADSVGPPVSEGEAVGQAGPEGKGGRWAAAGPKRKGGRWAAADPEMKGGWWAVAGPERKGGRWAAFGPKSLLGLKSKEVK